MNKIWFLILILGLAACKDPAKINVKNSLPKAVIRNAEWGGVPLAYQLYPGESSQEIKLRKNDYYDIKLPEKHPLKFHLELNGDQVYLETKYSFRLDVEENLTIDISDTTQVLNPALNDQ